MSQDSRFWNEILSYPHWLNPEFNRPRTFEDFKNIINHGDDGIGIKEIDALFKEVLKNDDPFLLDQVVNYFSQEFKHKHKKQTLVNYIKKIQKSYKLIRVKREEKEKNHEYIPFNNVDIEFKKDGIYENSMDKEGNYFPKQIIGGNWKIRFRVFDENMKIDRYSLSVDNVEYYTLTVAEIMRKFDSIIVYGTRGREIIKYIFDFLRETLKEKRAEYVIGFNDGWKLPDKNDEKDYAIILYTDIDSGVYERAKKMIGKYTDEQKEEIVAQLKTFINKTQTNKIKLTMIICWSLASPFRLAIIEYFKVFPHLYNYGERQSGKGSLEEFFIVNFYKIHDKLLSSKTLDSPSRLEDYLASSTFPFAITEADRNSMKYTLSILKEHATDNTNFERKRPDQTLAFRKTKTAGLCLDSNEIIEEFKDPALNSKCIVIEFTKEEKIILDFEWKNLSRSLKRKKLFTFLYEATKDWDNKAVFSIFETIIEETKNNIEDFGVIESDHPRVLSIYNILTFGLYLWKKSFGFPIEKFLQIGRRDMLEYLIQGRKIMPENLMSEFHNFCREAIYFDEGEINDFGKFQKGNNLPYLTCKLKEHENKLYYAFTQKNLYDFKKFTLSKYNMPTLYRLLEDGLSDKTNIIYKKTKDPESKKRINMILIKKKWFEEEDL